MGDKSLTLEDKKRYHARVRRSNYRASLRLEGFSLGDSEAINPASSPENASASFRGEALASWPSYRDTGRHLTGQETIEWLASWGNDGEGPPQDHE